MRVAVGDSQVVQATTVDKDGILVFGKTQGVTTIDIWSNKGEYFSYLVSVAPRGLQSNLLTIQAILKNSPGISVAIAGDKIMLEGNEINDEERRRVVEIMNRFPNTLDLTSNVGWDKMILLDVQVIELPSARMDELGLKWGASNDAGIATGVVWNPAIDTAGQIPIGSSLPRGMIEQGARSMLAINALLNARIALLSQQGEAVILAQPQLLTRSGSTAAFLAGGEVPYTTTDKNGQPNTVFKKYGVNLNITPQANGAGAIRSKIEIEVSSVDSSMMLASGPALRTRKATTEFNVKSGHTLVLGGFLSREKSSESQGLPGLSSIPLLGEVFQSKRKIFKQTELAILVTPTVLDSRLSPSELDALSIQGVLDREFSESSMVTTRLNNYRHIYSSQSSNDSSDNDQWEVMRLD
jgi:pilus assembly protein CpaC